MAMTPDPDMERDPRLAAAYRAGARAEPPARLDEAIRAAARREVGAGPVRAGVTRFRNWGVPLSLAAVVVLSVTVVMMMREEGADGWQPASPPGAPVPVEIVPRPPAAAGPGEVAQAPAAAVPQPALPRRPAVQPDAAASVAALEAVPVPAPQVQPQHRAAGTEPGVPATASSAKVVAAAEVARAESGVSAQADPVPAAPQPQLRSAPAPAVADAASGNGARAQSSAKPAQALLAVPAKNALWQDLADQPPEKWRARIAEWRRAGRIADADTLTVEFRRRFPAEAMPEDSR